MQNSGKLNSWFLLLNATIDWPSILGEIKIEGDSPFFVLTTCSKQKSKLREIFLSLFLQLVQNQNQSQNWGRFCFLCSKKKWGRFFFLCSNNVFKIKSKSKLREIFFVLTTCSGQHCCSRSLCYLGGDQHRNPNKNTQKSK